MDAHNIFRAQDEIFRARILEAKDFSIDGSVIKDLDDILPFREFYHYRGLLEAHFDRDAEIKYGLKGLMEHENALSTYLLTDLIGFKKEGPLPLWIRFMMWFFALAYPISHLRKFKIGRARIYLPSIHLFANLNSALPHLLKQNGFSTILSAYCAACVRLDIFLKDKVLKSKRTTLQFKGVSNYLDYHIERFGLEAALAWYRQYAKPTSYTTMYCLDVFLDHLCADVINGRYEAKSQFAEITGLIEKHFHVWQHDNFDVTTDKIVFFCKLAFLSKAFGVYAEMLSHEKITEIIDDLQKLHHQRFQTEVTQSTLKLKYASLYAKIDIAITHLVTQGADVTPVVLTLLKDR